MATGQDHRRGLFVTIDGPSGVGKTTLAQHLTQRLRATGRTVHITAEPSTGPIGALARALTDTASGTVLACLYAADRYHHLDTEITPRLATGQTVVSDRYLASGLVMQRLDGLAPDYLHAINGKAKLPGLALVLTGNAATVRDRLTQRGTHNRYQRRPDWTSIELRYFADAADHLERNGVPTLRMDTTDLDPAEVATRALDSITALDECGTDIRLKLQ